MLRNTDQNISDFPEERTSQKNVTQYNRQEQLQFSKSYSFSEHLLSPRKINSPIFKEGHFCKNTYDFPGEHTPKSSYFE